MNAYECSSDSHFPVGFGPRTVQGIYYEILRARDFEAADGRRSNSCRQ